MSTVFTLFMVAIIICCILLAIIILAQNPKGGGLSGTFGGSGASSFGVQRTNDFMEKATWTLGGIIVGLIFLSVVLTAKPSTTIMPEKISTKNNATTPSKTIPQSNQKEVPSTTVPVQKTK